MARSVDFLRQWRRDGGNRHQGALTFLPEIQVAVARAGNRLVDADDVAGRDLAGSERFANG